MIEDIIPCFGYWHGFILMQAYHVHIRSTSHLQKMMEKEKLKSNTESSSVESATCSATQSSFLAGPTKRFGEVKSAAAQGKLPPAVNIMDMNRGPNYCHVCCFEFSSSEVSIPFWRYYMVRYKCCCCPGPS